MAVAMHGAGTAVDGAFVVGMHRSGTSAITGVIEALGFGACRAEDRFAPRRWNARGNFESRTLTRFDDGLLHAFGGAWWAPPLPPPGWEHGVGFADALVEAAGLFAALHPARPWVWKDPRACVLLPFWDAVLAAAVPRVIVLRDPHLVAASLHERDEMGYDHALALADRSLHAALRDSAARPALIVSFDDVLGAPARACGAIVDFLATHVDGWRPPAETSAGEAFLDASLRHHRNREGATEPGGVSADDRLRAWEWAMLRRGAHSSLVVDDLPPESPRTGIALAAAIAAVAS